VTLGGALGPRGDARGAGWKGDGWGGGAPAAVAMARRGGAGGSGWRGGGEHMAPLYTRELG
jgi:hypothetical protein